MDDQYSQLCRMLRRSVSGDIGILRTALTDLARLYLERQADAEQEAGFAAESCIREVAHSSRVFEVAVSTWITESATVGLAKRVVSRASVDQLKSTTPLTYSLADTAVAPAILTGFRLCTIGATPAISLGWTLSLANAFQTSEEARRAVDLLLKYHVEEYPWTTRRLLSSCVGEGGADALAVEALAVLTDQEAWMASQPRLREFAMTPEMFSMFAGLKRNESRHIQRLSKQKSIFAQLCSTHQFKYSNRTTVEFAMGGLIEESALEMGEYELEVELPQSERTDPVGGALRRKAMWSGAPQ
jgi:hypothetical protein